MRRALLAWIVLHATSMSLPMPDDALTAAADQYFKNLTGSATQAPLSDDARNGKIPL